MWLLKKKHLNLVAISCTPTTIACAWICPSKKKHMYELKAYKRTTIDQFELAQGYINNPTHVDNHIVSFLTKHSLKNSFISIALRAPTIYENIVTLPTTIQDPTDIVIPNKQQSLWSHRYLYSQENAHATFYVCSIPQSLLFQYKLLVMRHRLNLIGVTTISMAYLQVYLHGYGVAFRHSQLAQDMARCHNNVDNLISYDIVRRHLIIAHRYAHDIDYELSTLTPLLGVIMSQKGIS